MPAIQPSRLKIQAADLAQHAGHPDEFCRAYHQFLDNYADRTFRSGQVGEPPPLIRAYQVPHPVLPALTKEMNQFSKDHRESALELADALWLEPTLEFRLLAASILGQISPQPFISLIKRIESWVGISTEDRLVKALIYAGLARYLQEYPDSYLGQIEVWLASGERHVNRLGLLAVPPLLKSSNFEDYPQLFNQLGKILKGEMTSLKTDILGIIEILALQAPDETAYYLGQLKKSNNDNPAISWYIRNSLGYFPPDSQRFLREIILNH
jgi:hypothetical protein